MKSSSNRFYYKQNRMKQLRAFCFAAQTESISRAAESMHISQPTASLLVGALEKELAVQLFERHGPRINLTPEGRILQGLAQPLVESLETLPEVFIQQCTQMVTGKLIVAAGESTLLYILPDVIEEYSSLYPQVEFHLHNLTGRDGAAMLRANEADLMVGSMPERSTDMDYYPVFSYEPVLMTPIGHPLTYLDKVTLKDIAQYELIMPPRHLSNNRITDMVFQQHGVDYKISLEAGGWEVIKQYVKRGLGISIATSICLAGNEDLAIIPLKEYFPRRTYGLIVRRAKNLSPAAKMFIEVMGVENLSDS